MSYLEFLVKKKERKFLLRVKIVHVLTKYINKPSYTCTCR